MEPTLLVGDRLFVTKYSYGYSKHSFPFSPPVLNGRIAFKEPQRGDVVVFKTPADNILSKLDSAFKEKGKRANNAIRNIFFISLNNLFKI